MTPIPGQDHRAPLGHPSTDSRPLTPQRRLDLTMSEALGGDIDIACPRCHRPDLVQSVAALYAAGLSTSYGTDTHTGIGFTTHGPIPVIGATTVERFHTSALARAFAPEPIPLPGARLLGISLLLAIIPLLTLYLCVLGFLEPGQPHDLPTFLGAMLMPTVFAVPAVSTFCAARSRYRRTHRITTGRPRAHHAWRTGYYCHRCGTAHWPYSPTPEIPARQPLTPQQYRNRVWHAGGYHNL